LLECQRMRQGCCRNGTCLTCGIIRPIETFARRSVVAAHIFAFDFPLTAPLKINRKPSPHDALARHRGPGAVQHKCCSAEPGPTFRGGGPRICSALLRAALRPGNRTSTRSPDRHVDRPGHGLTLGEFRGELRRGAEIPQAWGIIPRPR
jgi:hypothetical protein